MEKLTMQIIQGQGWNNEVTNEHPTIFVKVESPIGLSKEFKGALLELPVYNSVEAKEEDVVYFILEDVETTKIEEDYFEMFLRIKAVFRGDQKDKFFKISNLSNSLLFMDAKQLSNG